MLRGVGLYVLLYKWLLLLLLAHGGAKVRKSMPQRWNLSMMLRRRVNRVRFSLSGLVSSKAALMTVVEVPSEEDEGTSPVAPLGTTDMVVLMMVLAGSRSRDAENKPSAVAKLRLVPAD